MVEFNDVNEVIKYYAIKLSEASSTISTNDHNTGTYKNELAGEMIQETFSIKNPLKVLCTYKNHRFYLWWFWLPKPSKNTIYLRLFLLTNFSNVSLDIWFTPSCAKL